MVLSVFLSVFITQLRVSQDTCARLESKCGAAELAAQRARAAADSSSLLEPSGEEIELRHVKQSNDYLTAEVLPYSVPLQFLSVSSAAVLNSCGFGYRKSWASKSVRQSSCMGERSECYSLLPWPTCSGPRH